MADAVEKFYVLLPHATEKQVLVSMDGDQASLPYVTVPRGSDILDVRLVNRAVKAQWGADVLTLHSMHCYLMPEKHRAVFTMENRCAGWHPSGNMRWLTAEWLETRPIASALEQSILTAWFREQESRRRLLPWWQPGWSAQAQNWIERQVGHLGLQLTALPEQIKSWYISSVWRVSTSSDDLYFKAAPPYERQEITIASSWSDRLVSNVPDLVAIDPQRFWMLSRNIAGNSLEQLRSVSEWSAALCEYALFQQDTCAALSHLPAAEYIDMRLNLFPSRAARLFASLPALLAGLPERHTIQEYKKLDALLPAIQDRCDQALKFGIPHTLVHGDFHAMNVMRSGGKTVFFDWGGVCMSHPFFDVLELLSADDWLPSEQGAYDTLRDSYLNEWQAYEPWDRLQELYKLLRPLWILSGALAYERTLQGMESVVPLHLRPIHTCAYWATQQQQFGVTMQLRKLLHAFDLAHLAHG